MTTILFPQSPVTRVIQEKRKVKRERLGFEETLGVRTQENQR